jgi:hypothetical protein
MVGLGALGRPRSNTCRILPCLYFLLVSLDQNLPFEQNTNMII